MVHYLDRTQRRVFIARRLAALRKSPGGGKAASFAEEEAEAEMPAKAKVH